MSILDNFITSSSEDAKKVPSVRPIKITVEIKIEYCGYIKKVIPAVIIALEE